MRKNILVIDDFPHFRQLVSKAAGVFVRVIKPRLPLDALSKLILPQGTQP